MIVDNVSIAKSSGVFFENQTYNIACDNVYMTGFTYKNNTIENQNFTYGNHAIQIKFTDINASSSKQFGSDFFLNFKFNQNR